MSDSIKCHQSLSIMTYSRNHFARGTLLPKFYKKRLTDRLYKHNRYKQHIHRREVSFLKEVP